MLVEAIRLIVVMAAVLSANRLATADPSLLGVHEPADHRPAGHRVGGRRSPTSLGGVLARGVERLLTGAEERVSPPSRLGDRRAHRRAADRRASSQASSSWPLLVFVASGVRRRRRSPRSRRSSSITFTTRLAVRKRVELFGVLGVTPMPRGISGGCLLDSSAAIDGRVLALYRAGLLPQPLCVPAFIIWEMQGIADSADPLRRRRGRRGLDMLASLREAGVNVRVLDEDPAATTDPDAKLVVVARRRGLPIVTSDSNLAKVAELQGVGVLNLHLLAELVRPPVLPGETVGLRIVKAGRERGQGVGYLEDGTMVVVEHARRSASARTWRSR